MRVDDMCEVVEWLNGGLIIQREIRKTPVRSAIVHTFAYSEGNVWPCVYNHFDRDELLLAYIGGEHVKSTFKLQ